MTKFRAFISYRHVRSTRFAENLELALKAYAKPIYRPPIAVFRDEKYLRPGADLPARITAALEASEFLIFLASPEAAASPWVRRELSQWCEDDDRCGRLIIILTGGAIGVDDRMRIDWEKTDALPDVLAARLTSVPLYVDLAWAQREDQQTILNPEYKKAINIIVATLRGVDPIDLSGQEILQHRRNIRIRNTFIGAIGALAIALAAAAWFAWDQKIQADTRAREATSRRLAAEADRIAEERIDLALLLMAQASRMGDNTALRSSWWRVLGAPNLPDVYLPVRASDIRFDPAGALVVTTQESTVMFSEAAGVWSRAPAGLDRSTVDVAGTADWQWSGGCERQECDETPEWACGADERRIIGPYGDNDSFCVRSTLRVPDWCDGAAIDVPGFSVEARRSGGWVQVKTNVASGTYYCPKGSAEAPSVPATQSRAQLIAGDRMIFTGRENLTLVERGAPSIARVSVSFDGRWLAVLRSDNGVEIWSRRRSTTPPARPGMVVLDGTVQAIAATPDGMIALALSPAQTRQGDIIVWKDAAAANQGSPPERRLADVWVPRLARVGVLAFSADGRRLAMGADVEVPVIDAETGRVTGDPFYLGRRGTTFAEFSHDASRLAVVARALDGAIDRPGRVFGVNGPPRDVGRDVDVMAFPPGAADSVFTAGAHGVQQWTLPGGALERVVVEGAADRLAIDPRTGDLAISFPAGYLELQSSRDRSVVRSGRREGATWALGFMTSEPALLRAASTGLQAWSWPTDSWMAIDASPHRDVRALPNGLVLALRDAHAVIYDLRPARWMALTCAIVGRNLTATEWRTHIGDAFPYEATCPEVK